MTPLLISQGCLWLCCAPSTTRCLETASHESLSEAERRRLLHFVVVGGGPTGVEFSAELSDFIYQDIVRYYPEVSTSRCVLCAVRCELCHVRLCRCWWSPTAHWSLDGGVSCQLKSDISVTLIEGREILSSFDATLREYAMKRLKSGHVFVRTGGSE